MSKANVMAGATSWLRFWQTGPNVTVVQSHDRPEEFTYNILGYRNRIGWTFYRQSAEMTSGGKWSAGSRSSTPGSEVARSFRRRV